MLSLYELLQMMLQVPQGVSYALRGIQEQQHLKGGIFGGLGMTGKGDLLGGCLLG